MNIPILNEYLAHFSHALLHTNCSQLSILFDIQNQPPYSSLALSLAHLEDQNLFTAASTILAIDTPPFEVVHSFLLFLKAWGQCAKYDTLHRLYSQFYKAFVSWSVATLPPWGLPLLKPFQKRLIQISKLADLELKKRNITGDEHIQSTYELLQLTLKLLDEDPGQCSPGFLVTFNSLFTLYWKVDQLRRDQLWETLYSRPMNTQPYPKAQRVFYHYHMGHRLLQLGIYDQSEVHLKQALELCPHWSLKNHLKIVCAWVLCRFFQGFTLSFTWLQSYQLDSIFLGLFQALKKGDYIMADEWMQTHTLFLLQQQIYFILLDQLRYLMIRKCLRSCVSAFLSISDPDLSKSRRMPLRYFAMALNRMFHEPSSSSCSQDSLYSAYLKLTHLIAQGYARGYISLIHKIYVMPKTNDLNMIVAPIKMKK